jgi:hypothetical protein
MGYAIALPHAVRGVAVPYVAPMAVYCVRSMVWGRSHRVCGIGECARSYQSLLLSPALNLFCLVVMHTTGYGDTRGWLDGAGWYTLAAPLVHSLLCTGLSPAVSVTVTPSLSTPVTSTGTHAVTGTRSLRVVSETHVSRLLTLTDSPHSVSRLLIASSS